jgi:hypothetical protein
MIVAHPWHEYRNRSTTRPPTVASPNVAADHRFSEEDLVDLLSALRARAASHPDNPGLVACWPAVPAERMAAACRLLARRGHSVQPVPVAGWEPEKIRDGWRLIGDDGIAVAVSSAEFTTERAARDSADAIRADIGPPEPGR